MNRGRIFPQAGAYDDRKRVLYRQVAQETLKARFLPLAHGRLKRRRFFKISFLTIATLLFFSGFIQCLKLRLFVRPAKVEILYCHRQKEPCFHKEHGSFCFIKIRRQIVPAIRGDPVLRGLVPLRRNGSLFSYIGGNMVLRLTGSHGDVL